MDDDKFNSLCEAHSFGAVARGEFPLMPRGLLKALVDAAVVAERERWQKWACRKEWDNVNDPPCHPSDKGWRPCDACEGPN